MQRYATTGGPAEGDSGVKTLYFVTVFLLCLVTGVFWGTWFSLSRSIASIEPDTFLEIGRTMIGNLGGPMRVLMPITLASLFLLSLVLYRQRRKLACVLTVASLLLLLAALIVTLKVNVPIDREIVTWTVTTLPGDWKVIRDRWEFYHGLRTLLSLFAFGSLLAGNVWGFQSGKQQP
ncbi:MAG TPA: anthrone oxygenase family protein [Terriglobales bacterium]|nr:anthrone oxygenase family protein [Terriglobales bacterium]